MDKRQKQRITVVLLFVLATMYGLYEDAGAQGYPPGQRDQCDAYAVAQRTGLPWNYDPYNDIAWAVDYRFNKVTWFSTYRQGPVTFCRAQYGIVVK